MTEKMSPKDLATKLDKVIRDEGYQMSSVEFREFVNESWSGTHRFGKDADKAVTVNVTSGGLSVDERGRLMSDVSAYLHEQRMRTGRG